MSKSAICGNLVSQKFRRIQFVYIYVYVRTYVCVQVCVCVCSSQVPGCPLPDPTEQWHPCVGGVCVRMHMCMCTWVGVLLMV